MALDWKVGDRVVCVEGGSSPNHKPILAGEVYTIREFLDWCGVVGLALVEIENEVSPFWGGEFGYVASRFRKVRPGLTNITIFTAMLHDTTEKVDA